jgi:hypothetical protein
MPASTAHGPSRCGSLGTGTRAARPLIKSQRPLFQTEMLPAPISDVRSGVNRDTFTVGQPLPIYPRQRTSPDRRHWSGSCHEETSDLLWSPWRSRLNRPRAGLRFKEPKTAYGHCTISLPPYGRQQAKRWRGCQTVPSLNFVMAQNDEAANSRRPREIIVTYPRRGTDSTSSFYL